jgi:hypothetical protein
MHTPGLVHFFEPVSTRNAPVVRAGLSDSVVLNFAKDACRHTIIRYQLCVIIPTIRLLQHVLLVQNNLARQRLQSISYQLQH